MAWFVGTSGTRSRWLFPLVLAQFWLFMLVFIVGYFVSMPSNFVHKKDPGYLQITHMPRVLYSADTSMTVGDCTGVVTLLDLTNFPIADQPISAKVVLIKPIPMFEYCALGTEQIISTAVTEMLEPICRVTKPILGMTSSTGQAEFNLCLMNGPPGLYSLQFDLSGVNSVLNVSISQHIRMIAAPYQLKLNDEAPAILEPDCNSTASKTCSTGPQNARILFANEPVSGIRIVLAATHVSMLPHILGVDMTAIRSITRWPALSMLSYGAATLLDCEVTSDALGFFNFSKLNIIGYTAPTVSLVLYFGGRLQLWNGVENLNSIYWVRESSIRREFSARMNAPCAVKTQPAESDGLVTVLPGTFLKLSGKFCSFLNDASGMIEVALARRIGFIHIIPSFDITALDSGRSREYFKHPVNATTGLSLADGSFSITTKFTSEGQPGTYTLFFVADGQIMLSRRLFFPKTSVDVTSKFFPRSFQSELLKCQKLYLRLDPCYNMEPFSMSIGSEFSPSIRLTRLEKVAELTDTWHVGIAGIQARLYILPTNFTESLAISAPNFPPNSLSFMSQESGVISFPEVAVSHLGSAPASLQYFAEQAKIRFSAPGSNVETAVQRKPSLEYNKYIDVLRECGIPTCSVVQVTKFPSAYLTPFPAAYQLLGVNEDLDIRASIFDSEFSFQRSELLVLCAIFIKRHLWENGLRFPSNSYQGSRVCNQNFPTGWSSSRSRPSRFSTVRYVLEPGEYVWFLQADAALTSTLIWGQSKNQSFFFEGQSNETQFLTQIPPKPRCRNAATLAQKSYDRCRSNYFFGSFGVRLPIVQFDGSTALVATFQPSLDFVDLHSKANGAMKNMDSIRWWRAEIKQGGEAYLQVNDYMLAGEAEDPADNPISQKFIHPASRGSCNVLHGNMENIVGFSFSRNRNPSIPSGSVNDILANYFYFTTITLRWSVPAYTLAQCTISGVQSPILEIFPVMLSPSQTYQGCGDYPEAAHISGSGCTSRSKFVLRTNLTCFPIGVTLPNVTFAIKTFDGQSISQQEQFDLDLLEMDVKDSIISQPYQIVRLNANEAQVSGMRFSFIQTGDTFLRMYIRGSTKKDSFMLSTIIAPAPDEIYFEMVTGSSIFLIGAPAVPFQWKVSLVSNCNLEGAVDDGLWVPPAVELALAVCHANSEIHSFSKNCQIANEFIIDSNPVLQSRLEDATFQLAASVRLTGGSPEISKSNWRLVIKTIQNGQIVWMSDLIQISFGTVALKVVSSSNEVCYVGARCVFEFRAMNPYGIPVPGTLVTIANHDESITNFSCVSRFHSAVSNRHGLLTLSVEFVEEVGGEFAILEFIVHDCGGTRFYTTKNVSVISIVDIIINSLTLELLKDMASTAFAPSFHFRSNKTDLTFLGIGTKTFLITTESGKDDKQLNKPTFAVVDTIGNNLVVLKTESSIFLTNWKGDKIKNSTNILEASTPEMQGGLVFKFEYMIINAFVDTGFYRVNYCFLGKCLKSELEIFVKNTLPFDDTFAEAIFAFTVFMSILVFALLPWSFHSSKPDAMSKKKMIIFFFCVMITTILHVQVALLLRATSLKKNYLNEFDFVVTAYSIIIPILICLCSLKALMSYYDSRFNSSEDAFRTNEQLAIRLMTGKEKTVSLIIWCRFTIERLKQFQTEKLQKTLASRPKRQFRNASLISIHTLRIIWSNATDRFVRIAIPIVTLLHHLTETYTPYEKTAFQKISEYVASPRLLTCFVIPLILFPLLLFLVRVGVRVFEQTVYDSVSLITRSNASWVRSNQVVSIQDFFNDASETSIYKGRSVRELASDSIYQRIMLYFSQILLSRDVQLMHDFLNQFRFSANVSSVFCIIAATLGFLRFFIVYREYVHVLRERGRRILIDSKIDFAMHKSSSLVPGQFWSSIIGFFVAFLVFMLVCMIARWEPLTKYLASSVINPLVVALILHYVAAAISRVSDSLFVPNLSVNSLWMPRRRLFSLYELFMTIFAWISAVGSMVFRFFVSSVFWICLAPMAFFQQKSLSFKATDKDIVGSQRFIAAIGVDHVIDSPLTAAVARLLIQNVDNYTARLAFDKSKCDPLAIHMELQQYTGRDHRRFLMSRWVFLANLSSGTQAAADIKALRKPSVGASYKKLPVTGFGSTQNYWNIVKMDSSISDFLRKKEKHSLLE